MLKEVKAFNCNLVHTSIYNHPNYSEHKKLLINNKFKLVQTNREYSCNIRKVDIKKYQPLINKLELEGIKFYDSKESMRDYPSKLPNHYKKLEEMEWTYAQDFPIPDGIKHTRAPLDHFMKYCLDYYKNVKEIRKIIKLFDIDYDCSGFNNGSRGECSDVRVKI